MLNNASVKFIAIFFLASLLVFMALFGYHYYTARVAQNQNYDESILLTANRLSQTLPWFIAENDLGEIKVILDAESNNPRIDTIVLTETASRSVLYATPVHQAAYEPNAKSFLARDVCIHGNKVAELKIFLNPAPLPTEAGRWAMDYARSIVLIAVTALLLLFLTRNKSAETIDLKREPTRMVNFRNTLCGAMNNILISAQLNHPKNIVLKNILDEISSLTDLGLQKAGGIFIIEAGQLHMGAGFPELATSIMPLSDEQLHDYLSKIDQPTRDGLLNNKLITTTLDYLGYSGIPPEIFFTPIKANDKDYGFMLFIGTANPLNNEFRDFLSSISLIVASYMLKQEALGELSIQKEHSKKIDDSVKVVGDISHDLNNVLGSIIGSAEILKRHLDNTKEGEKFYSYLIDSALKGAVLVKQLLGVSRNQVPDFEPASKKDEVLPMNNDENLVLIIDDDPVIQSVLSSHIEDYGYHPLTCSSGPEALNLLQSYKDNIRFVILDMVIPEMSGPVCYKKIKEISPSLPIIICSGNEKSFNDGCIEPGIYLPKPFTKAQLKAAIDKLPVSATHL